MILYESDIELIYYYLKMESEHKDFWDYVNALDIKGIVAWKKRQEFLMKFLEQHNAQSVVVTHLLYFSILCYVLPWICVYMYKFLYGKYFYKSHNEGFEFGEVTKAESRYILLCTTSSKDLIILIIYNISFGSFLFTRAHSVYDPMFTVDAQYLNIVAIILSLCSSTLISIYIIHYIRSLSLAIDKIKLFFNTWDKFFVTFLETNVIYGAIVITSSMTIDSILICISYYYENFNMQISVYVYGAVSMSLSLILFILDMIYLQISAVLILPYINQILILLGIYFTYANTIDGVELVYGCSTLMIIVLALVRFSVGVYKNINMRERDFDE